ncbi:ribose-phosphate diphosphokinase, partial [Patescibacteria group bacterium]|nr:ribose-phosphate diphosphokinase [Patescibacteria group bacterium]
HLSAVPLDLVIARKIGHPLEPEFAIGAIAEDGHLVRGETLTPVDETWFQKEAVRQQKEAKRRREKYLKGRLQIPAKDKIAIIVDDGIATGLTVKAAIEEIKHKGPKKIVVAVSVAPEETVKELKPEIDDFVALDIPRPSHFAGAIGIYYEYFPQVTDEEVIAIIKKYNQRFYTALSKAHIDPVLFTLPSYQYVAKELKQIPNTYTGSFSSERFANNELYIKLHTDVNERECIILGSIAPPDTNLITFLLLSHTLKKEGGRKITAVLPYLAYSRQDKKEPRKSYTAALIGELLNASGVDEAITIDIHSPYLKHIFPIPLVSLSPAKIFAREIVKLLANGSPRIKDVTIVAPDEGARKRSEDVAREIGVKRKIAYIMKKRTIEGVKSLELYGKLSQKVIIVDDILDTGKTLISCCEKLQEKGVKEIYIMVTHGLFTGKEWEKLWGLGVKRIYCTDTVPLPKKALSERITVLSIIPLLVEALKEKYQGIFTISITQGYRPYDIDEP